MQVGTKSVLFGAHCFFLHPFFVAWAWTKLYGFPWDFRLWVAFFVHDIGYWGKPNMDGPEGEAHPTVGAQLMSALFDHDALIDFSRPNGRNEEDYVWIDNEPYGKWGQFCLFHSRYYAKSKNAKPSKLCYADKLSLTLIPHWLYLPMVTATGEVEEYLKNAQKAENPRWKPTGYDKKKWFFQLQIYMAKWVEEHFDGREDTWTQAGRNKKEA